jgi:uncharacterized protein YwgA
MSVTINRLDRLKVFLIFLHKNGIIDISKVDEESDEGFINRLKIQKCVYLAKYYGLDLGYEYNMYIYGPYSTELSNDYYSIINDIKDYNREVKDGFDSVNFLEVVKDKDAEWLEVAVTLLDLHVEYGRNIEKLIMRVYVMKDRRYSKEYIKSVYEELRRLKLIN